MSDKGPQFMPSAVQNTEFNEGIYRELIDKSLLGLAIIQDRRLIYANERLAEIIGHSLEDMLVLSADNFMSLIHPDDRTGILGALIDGISSNKLPLRRSFVLSGRKVMQSGLMPGFTASWQHLSL
ncbi:MAG: PAS domain-containing protein [Methanothrix sp.]|nr:PAS domain-containing protein [Methanothrix sp.]